MAHPISLFQAAVIGVIEGLTEFLPISSTAHMDIVPQFLGWEDPGAAFSAVVQLGPLIAIVAYFANDLLRYMKGILRSPNPLRIPNEDTDAKMGWYTLLATPPVLILGKLLETKIEGVFRGLAVVAWSLILFSLLLWAAERVSKRNRPMESMTLRECLIIGFAQAISLIPGASRSGVTMTAALFQNFDRESATRFSFLLSIPALLAAGLYKLVKDVLRSPDAGAMALPYLVGTITAGVSAYLVIRWFLGFVRRHNTNVFIVYRILLGVLILMLLQVGRFKNVPEKGVATHSSSAVVAAK